MGAGRGVRAGTPATGHSRTAACGPPRLSAGARVPRCLQLRRVAPGIGQVALSGAAFLVQQAARAAATPRRDERCGRCPCPWAGLPHPSRVRVQSRRGLGCRWRRRQRRERKSHRRLGVAGCSPPARPRLHPDTDPRKQGPRGFGGSLLSLEGNSQCKHVVLAHLVGRPAFDRG